MDKSLVSAVLFVAALLYISCSRDSNAPTSPGPITFAAAEGGCARAGIAKGAIRDLSFTYVFTDRLLVNFSVMANCCPDSARFVISHTSLGDTLRIAVLDTAENLCRCVCAHMIHAEFGGLPLDHYVVVCEIGDSLSSMFRLYVVDVYRQF